MSLLEEIKKIGELEQKDDKSTLGWMLLDHAPAMLEVLGCFQKGDAETLGEILDVFQFDGEPMSGVYAACIKRLQEAASLMEQEAR
ncbi:MAG TPA: hypothetical protein PKX20_09145 [Methanothrix soehngenii]|nr:hypothetical protein [Methanothrix soehngenii]